VKNEFATFALLMDVQLFIPCFVDQLFPHTAMNMVKVLEKLGCKVSYNPKQTCCGQPAFNAGYWHEAKNVAQKFIRDFSEETCIVSPSGSCTGYVRNYFGKLFENSAAHNLSQQVAGNVFEFSEFIANVLEVEDLGAKFSGRATYHDACGALRECGIKEAPRKLLRRVEGLELIEMLECETCCGFGGTFATKFEPISIGMAQTKVKSALDTGARYMVSTDMSCLMHLRGYIHHYQLPLEALHIADVLASGW
jgi:L-lactate dehydrogenase complex protein LldE